MANENLDSIPEARNLTSEETSGAHRGLNAPIDAAHHIDLDSPALIQDPETAKAMAVAEDEDRTMAAKNRMARSVLDAYPDEHREKERDIQHTLPIPEVTARFGKKRREQEQAREEGQRRHTEAKDELLAHEERAVEALEAAGVDYADAHIPVIEAGQVGRGDNSNISRHFGYLDKLSQRAVEHDNRARELGEWAQALHEHAPSEAFMATNSSLYDFDVPYELWEIQHHFIDERTEMAVSAQETAEELKAQPPENLHEAQELIGDLASNYSIGSKTDVSDELLAKYAAESRGIAKELFMMMKGAYADGKTVADIKALPAKLYEKAGELEMSESRAFERALEDIRSGKAADADYHVEAIPTGQLAGDLTREGRWHAKQAEKWLDVAGNQEGPEKERALGIAATHAHRAEAAELAAHSREALAPGDSDPPGGGRAEIGGFDIGDFSDRADP